MGHVPRLQRKSLTSPDLVRSFPFGHVDIVNLDETSVARFSWEPGSLAFWDNRACQHFAASDYHPQRRVMERVTIAGDRPYFTP